MSQSVRAAEVAQHAPRLRRVLSRTLGPDADSADLLQDVYVAALESMSRLRDPRALPAWLSQIAVNVAHAHIRSKMRDRAARRLLSTWDQESELDSASPLPLSVEQLLRKLPHEERAATALRFLADYELRDVAAACQVSLPTVKRRLASARRRLRRHAGRG